MTEVSFLPSPRALFASLLVAAAYLASGSAVTRASADTCPNATFRTGPSASLADCRAYELVSPPEAQADALQGTRASAAGDRLSFYSFLIPPTVPNNGNVFLATRNEAGWSSEGVIPPQSTADANLCGPNVAFWSTDFERGLLMDGPYNGVACPQDDPPLVAGEPRGFQNLFVRDNAGPTYQLVNLTPAGVDPSDALPQAASSDLSHVVFESAAPLTADSPALSPGETNTYVWSDGVVRLVPILPDGTPTVGRIVNARDQLSPGTGGGDGAGYTHALSADGSGVLFVAGGNLYLRQHPDRPQSPFGGSGACSDPALACTVQVDAPQGPGPGGGGAFMWATPDGSQVFFAAPASSGLTGDTEPGSGQNLYRYDVGSGGLTDLTPAADAQLQGVSGASDDGSHLYFVADGALASDAAAGQPNLYLRHGDSTIFIATLAPIAAADPEGQPYEACDWTAACLTARVSRSGRFIAFNSTRSLTGYDSVPQDPTACDLGGGSGSPCAEIYLYDATADQLNCASCDPSGAPPTAASSIPWPGLLVERSQLTPGYLERSLSENGRVFFDSPDALLPADANGKQDVYEYENGQLHLLSTGTSGHDSFFNDASTSGDDVFFATDQALALEDGDAANSIYDARVDGGFAEPAAQAPQCEGESCRGAGIGAGEGSPPGSAAFEGPGNRPHLHCRKRFVRRHGRCVKRRTHGKRRGHGNGRAAR